jgi:hypothetical protein
VDKEQRTEINRLCFEIGIGTDKALKLLDGTDFEVTMQVLAEVSQSNNDLLSKPVLFDRIARRARKAYAREANSREQKQDYDEMVRKWEEARGSGYVPDKRTIFNQLLVMYKTGEITELEYRVGTTVGLKMVSERNSKSGEEG